MPHKSIQITQYSPESQRDKLLHSFAFYSPRSSFLLILFDWNAGLVRSHALNGQKPMCFSWWTCVRWVIRIALGLMSFESKFHLMPKENWTWQFVLASMHGRVIKILWCHYGFRGRATRIATYRVQKTVSMNQFGITISDCLIVYPLCQESLLMLLLDKKYLSLSLLAVAPRSRQRNYSAKEVRGCRPWPRQISQRLNFQIEDSIVLDLVPQELADLRRRFSTLRAVQSSEQFSEASVQRPSRILDRGVSTDYISVAFTSRFISVCMLVQNFLEMINVRKFHGSSAESCPNLDLPSVWQSTYLEDPAFRSYILSNDLHRMYIYAEWICVLTVDGCVPLYIATQEFQTLPLQKRGSPAAFAASLFPFRKKSGRPAWELGAVRVFFCFSSCLVGRSAALIKPVLFYLWEKAGPCGVQTL